MCDICEDIERGSLEVLMEDDGTILVGSKRIGTLSNSICIGKDENGRYIIEFSMWLGLNKGMATSMPIEYCPFCGRKLTK